MVVPCKVNVLMEHVIAMPVLLVKIVQTVLAQKIAVTTELAEKETVLAILVGEA